MNKSPTFFLNHPRAVVSWFVRAVPDSGNATGARIIKVARVVHIPPGKGGSTTLLMVQDWGMDGDNYPPHNYMQRASGWGYDRTKAAMEGATVGGVKLDGWRSPEDHARRIGNGLEYIGSL